MIPTEWLDNDEQREDPCNEANFDHIANPRIKAIRIKQCKQQEEMKRQAKIRQARLEAIKMQEMQRKQAEIERDRVIQENKQRIAEGLDPLPVPPLPAYVKRRNDDFIRKCEEMSRDVI